MEERFLTDRAAKGDESAFRALLERYKNRIYALAYRFSGNHEDAEDISQEVVIKIYRYLPGFDNRSLFSTWVYSITKNTCLDFLRKKKGDTESLEDLDFMLTDHRYDTEGDAIRNEQLSSVAKLVNALPKDQRQILILREIDGFSYEEISELLGIPLGTVKSRLARTKAAIRAGFEEK